MSESPPSETYHERAKVYQAGDHLYSIVDLLGSAVSPDYMTEGGLSRISDFHIKVGQPIRYRLDQELQVIPSGTPLTPEIAEKLIFPMLHPEQIQRLRDDAMCDVDAGYQLPGGHFYFRVNVFRDRAGLAAVVRLLPPVVPPIEDVGFPNDVTWQSIVGAKQGLVLVTGVTGSGKSTTIASLLQRINETRSVHVLTLEDPIEFIFESKRALFSQREVGRHAPSFSAGLRSVLRENPDIIYVGEIRDAETASQALTAAETGHLVLSTMHTRDTTGALSRLVDMFPGERSRELLVQLSFALSYVLGQKLVPRADGAGRCVAMEILRNSPAIGNLIRTGNWAQIYGTIETRVKEGTATLEQSLFALYEAGIITREDAIIHANDASILDRLENRASMTRRY